jgi:hypothetical protein
MNRQRTHSGAPSLQAYGSGREGVRPAMRSDEDIPRGGAAARRRYLMRYVACAVAISAAICIAAGVRAAGKRATDAPADVSLRPAIVRTVEPAATARAVESASAHPLAEVASVSATPAPPPMPLPQAQPPAAVAPRPLVVPAQRAAPRRKDRSATILHEAPY